MEDVASAEPVDVYVHLVPVRRDEQCPSECRCNGEGKQPFRNAGGPWFVRVPGEGSARRFTEAILPPCAIAPSPSVAIDPAVSSSSFNPAGEWGRPAEPAEPSPRSVPWPSWSRSRPKRTPA